ncbi:MAG: hypothetical protein PHQ40_06890 [Anaerolineaceae bacterium]|nr:hypothetical protein [Anaerolineaceae bacterium]
MINRTDQKPEQPKIRRYYTAIAFAFGLGASFGAAISYWITNILNH